MAEPSTANYLMYANLQMAAEAFLVDREIGVRFQFPLDDRLGGAQRMEVGEPDLDFAG